jgi:CRP/FNR family cyclic AMP-dependent transcriptional regulator
MTSGSLGQVYAPGEIVILQGDTGDAMFVIQQGQAEILVEQDGTTSRVNVVGEGEIIGEMAIFEKEARSATVRALSEMRVLTVDKKNFLRRISEDPSIAFNLVQMMSRRIRQLTARLADLESARARDVGSEESHP